MIIIIKGDLFKSEVQTIVNTVNCVGVMGVGVALKAKIRYPKMFERYKDLCEKGLIKIGSLWLYKENESRWVLCFPTKEDWKNPSKVEYLIFGLEKFIKTYKEKGITSIAFPLLGAGNGGLDPILSLDIMERYLSKCDIPIEIYVHVNADITPRSHKALKG